MENRQLFALGTYTALGGPGIRVFALENGKMSPLYDVYVEDPIWLELSADGRHLYAACGGEGPAEGFVASFAPADGDYAKGLVPEARREAHGVCPCHLCVAGGDLISANYADGCVSVFPLEDGVPGEMSQQLRHHGRGPHPLRQVCAHVHQVLPLGENAFQAQDLGIDRLVRYAKRDGQWVKTAEIPVHLGDGPRHALVNGGVMYLLTLPGKALGIPPFTVTAAVNAFADVTQLEAVFRCGLPEQTLLPLCAGLLSFGGCCVLMQCMTVGVRELHIGRLLLTRLAAAVLAGVLARICLPLLPLPAEECAAVFAQHAAVSESGSVIPAFLIFLTGFPFLLKKD